MASSSPNEAALAARWHAGEFSGRWLRTARGEEVRILFAGRPGGPAGPDFRDAVIQCRDGRRLYGDIELHLRARGWQAHGHDRDRRYNQVILHVVRQADGMCMTQLASGSLAALVEVENSLDPARGVPDGCAVSPWPCAGLARRLGSAGVRALLHQAGDARFEQRTRAFAQALMDAEARENVRGGADLAPMVASQACAPCAPLSNACERPARVGVAASPHPMTMVQDDGGLAWHGVDRVLFTALAEGLAYGRDRETLRQAGAWLAGGGAPDALTRELPRVSALDGTRLRGMLAWFTRWEREGPWAPLKAIIEAEPAATASMTIRAALTVRGGVISAQRAAILLVNVVLPCATAIARRERDHLLAARAHALYADCGGLPSNQITREMCRQVGLPRQPSGARAQQGLHAIWAMYCREKHCSECPCAAPR
jgi:hypothetical protein